MDAQFLGQQQLVAPEPRRRIIVRRGRSAWYGVDPGTSRVAVAYVASDGRRGARTASFPELDGGARLAAIWRETRRIALEVAGEWPAPGLVWVEHPFGKDPNPPLLYATGVIQAALCDALDVRVETVPSASWKRSACGSGAIYKPTKKKLGRRPVFEDYGVARWAVANGYGGHSWDEADAWGIAEAARREVLLEER